MTDPGADLLPSVERLLARAGARDPVADVDANEICRLPAFSTDAWKRSIGEFLRWSGTTPDPKATSSVFRLVLNYGPAGARALFEAYRHDRLERAATFDEADAQLEAVRTIVSMAAHWVHAIDWDLRAAPRMSAEEFRAVRKARPVGPGSGEGPGAERADPRFSDAVERLLRDPGEAPPRRESRASVPVFPTEPPTAALWKRPPQGQR
jgi:hypothetical protein